MSHIVDLRCLAWFGDGSLRLSFPERWELSVIEPRYQPQLNPEGMITALEHPVDGPPLTQIAAYCKRAVIIVDDLTRPTPTREVLKIVVDLLMSAGLGSNEIRVIIAGGTHEIDMALERDRKIGNSIPAGIEIAAHDSKSPARYLGRTSRGTPVFVNEDVMDCDLKIGVSGLYPHPAAGFSGGAKIIAPGVAGRETIQFMHDRLQGSGRRGGRLDSDFRNECETIAELTGLNFSINLLINRDRQVTGLFCGGFRRAFQAGVESARDFYQVNRGERADLVIADAYPFDMSLQSALDRGFWPLFEADGPQARLAISACPLGIGRHELYPVKRSFLIRLSRWIRNFSPKNVGRVPDQFVSMFRLLKRKATQVDIISPHIAPPEFRSVFFRGRSFASWDAAQVELLKKFPRKARVALYRCAPLLFVAPEGNN